MQQNRCMVFVPSRFSQAWHIFGQHARGYSTMSSAPTTRLGLLISPTCCLLPNAATAPNLHRALPCMAPQIKLPRAPLRYAQLVLRPTPGPLGINSAACTEHSSPVHHHSSCHVFPSSFSTSAPAPASSLIIGSQVPSPPDQRTSLQTVGQGSCTPSGSWRDPHTGLGC